MSSATGGSLKEAVVAQQAASVFNSKPHIDSCENILKELVSDPKEPMTDGFAYCLPHYHFKLQPGEVLLFEVEENKDGSVERVHVRVGQYSEGLYPYQYYSNGSEYVPVGFTHQEKYKCTLPDKHLPQLGIVSDAFAPGMYEFTYEEPRVQVFVKDVNEDNHDRVLITMMKKTGAAGPPGKCVEYVACIFKEEEHVKQLVYH